MLEEIEQSADNISSDAEEVLFVFKRKALLARTIRSLGDILESDSTEDISQDMRTELRSHLKRTNQKHEGGHFATTLLLPGIPIQVYKHSVGLLFDLSKVAKIHRLCFSDAYDDEGTLNPDVKTANNSSEFVTTIQKEKPNHHGLVTMNEVQVALTDDSRKAIFATFNFYPKEPNPLDKMAAYLCVYSIHLFLLNKFKINLPIMLYNQGAGQLIPVTRAPTESFLKECMRELNLKCYSGFYRPNFSHTERASLIEINKIFCERLNVRYVNEEFLLLINASLNASKQQDIQCNIEEVNDQIRNLWHLDGSDFRYSQSNACYQLIITTKPDDDTHLRVLNLISYLKNKNKVVLDVKNKAGAQIVSMNEEELSAVRSYFYHHEDLKFRKKAARRRLD